jgi:hypothetical protein
MFLGSKARWVRRADNLTTICRILNISQPYRPASPVTGIALLFFFLTLLCEESYIAKQLRIYIQLSVPQLTEMKRYRNFLMNFYRTRAGRES